VQVNPVRTDLLAHLVFQAVRDSPAKLVLQDLVFLALWDHLEIRAAQAHLAGQASLAVKALPARLEHQVLESPVSVPFLYV